MPYRSIIVIIMCPQYHAHIARICREYDGLLSNQYIVRGDRLSVIVLRTKYEIIETRSLLGRPIYKIRVSDPLPLDSYRDYVIRLRSDGVEVVVYASYFWDENVFVVVGEKIDDKRLRKGLLEVLEDV